MDIVEKLLRQADADDKAGTLYAHEIGREAAAEIKRLRARCAPSRVVMIGNTGHYVSEAVAAEIGRLRASLADTLDFVERHSNRWDNVNGKHPMEVVSTARELLTPNAGGKATETA